METSEAILPWTEPRTAAHRRRKQPFLVAPIYPFAEPTTQKKGTQHPLPARFGRHLDGVRVVSSSGNTPGICTRRPASNLVGVGGVTPVIETQVPWRP